jgi:hypothetical protein
MYLLSTYFPHAKVDWLLAEDIPVKQDGRKLDVTIEEEIQRLLIRKIAILQIHRLTGVSRQKISAIKASLDAA